MLEKQNFAEGFIEFLNKNPSTYHIVREAENKLKDRGYEKIYLNNEWKLEENKKYFLTIKGSTLIAFNIGSKDIEKYGIRMTGSHTDYPCFKLKPIPEVKGNYGYLRLNIEKYGSPIYSTWLDRPLSIAGNIILKGETPFRPKIELINIDKPLLTIPNLSIHQNREVNKGIKLNIQKDLLPIIETVEDSFNEKGYIENLLSSEFNIIKEDILDFNLSLYPYEKGCLLGKNKSLLSVGRIDNLASFYSNLEALLESEKNDFTKILLAFDGEEIGNTKNNAADSNIVNEVINKIMDSLNKKNYRKVINKSFFLSVDGAHATHPAHKEKSDPYISVSLNKGIAIKSDAINKYSTTNYTRSVVKTIFDIAKLPYQIYVNNSDMPSGSTLGPFISRKLGINSVDIGIPMLAMHSSREFCGANDLYDLKEFIKKYYLL